MLAILALLLAQPQWLNYAQPPESHAWVLIAPELLGTTDGRLQERIDSLAAAGYERRVFATDFPALNAKRMQQSSANYWSLARELDERIHSSKPVWIFSSAAMPQFRGERPAVAANFMWQTHATSQHGKWLHAAKLVRKDSLQLLIGNGTAKGTTFTRIAVNLASAPGKLSLDGMPPVEVFPSQEGRALELLQRPSASRQDSIHLTILEEPQNITIHYDEQHGGDRRYVQMALETAAEFAHENWHIRAERLVGNGQVQRRSAIVFWLSERPVAQKLMQHIEAGTILITDARETEYHTISSWIVPRGVSMQSYARLWRRAFMPTSGLVLWQDAQGEALLTAEPVGAGWHIRFQSRFHPQWNELVLHSMFPELMLRLIERRDFVSDFDHKHEQRRLTRSQVQPRTFRTGARDDAPAHATSLHLPLWLLAAVLFACERWFSERRTS